MTCDMVFGCVLQFRDTEEGCCLCEGAARALVQFPKCEHQVCPRCMRSVMFFEEPDVEDEWESSHPLEYQRCPICRQRQCREYGKR